MGICAKRISLDPLMLAAIDVQYDGNDARAGLVLFRHWGDTTATATYTHWMTDCANYTPGNFYLREMPVILEVLTKYPGPLDSIIVDCYVNLDQHGTPGLGQRLFDHHGGNIPVIGVAKSRYRDSQHAIELRRGESHRPLFVTAAGISAADAANRVASMHGRHRIPELIKLADRIARQAVAL